jgi:predicted dehydrogenase
MQVIRERIDRPLFAEVHRMGPFPDRSTDVDVVRDVMIHDLEILQRLLGEEPSRIDAIGVPVLSSEVDIANARLHFPGGCVANLTASRVSATPMRKLRFFQRDGYFSIDFLEQKAVVFRREAVPGGGPPRIGMEQLETDPADALQLQLESFVEAIREGRSPVVDAAGGLAALRTALRVREAMPDLDPDVLVSR